ncbi:MAG: sulfurtransferase [bacterium]|nr:sulfurtransferase [bacterium]
MNIIKQAPALIIAFLFIIPSIFAQVDYISASDYIAKLKTDNNMVTVHAGKLKDYQTANLKGSILFSYKDTEKPGEIKGLMKSPEDLAKILGKAGISQNNTIILYDEGTQKYSSRVYWLLKYLGVKEVYLLHKDIDAWRSARVPLTAAQTTLKATTFEVNINENLLATTDLVKTAPNNSKIVIVDARDTIEYNGTDGKSKGHIPSAIHINYKDFVTESGAFKSKEEIQAIVEKAGIRSDKEVILYCQTSIRGAVSYFAFKNILGFENVKLYDGAVEEWQATNNPFSK